MKKRIKRVLSISLIKTIKLNYIYFGWYGLVHPYIVVSKYTKLLEVGGKVVIDSKLPIGAITIGFPDITIFDVRYERSIWCNSGVIEFKGSAHLGQGTRITNRGILTIGEKFGISANSTICCDNNIRIGNNVLLSWDVLIMDSDVHKIYSLDAPERSINTPKEIVIGNNVWLSCRTTILKGVYIGDNCVVAAGSTIYKNLSEKNCIVAENGVIKKNINWKI